MKHLIIRNLEWGKNHLYEERINQMEKNNISLYLISSLKVGIDMLKYSDKTFKKKEIRSKSWLNIMKVLLIIVLLKNSWEYKKFHYYLILVKKKRKSKKVQPRHYKNN